MNSYLLLIAGILIILSAFASRISTRFGIPVLLIFMGIGILGSISPVLSNYRGAGKEPEKYFYPSLFSKL